jgi:inorganic pyrophosphatase/exopolyphosphatase
MSFNSRIKRDQYDAKKGINMTRIKKLVGCKNGIDKEKDYMYLHEQLVHGNTRRCITYRIDYVKNQSVENVVPGELEKVVDHHKDCLAFMECME